MVQSGQEQCPVPLIDLYCGTDCGMCVVVCPTDPLAAQGAIAVMMGPDVSTSSGHYERLYPEQAISRLFQIICIPKETTLIQPAFYPDWHEKAIFSPTGPQPQILAENEKLKVIVGSLDVGQKIPPHPEALAVYHFLEGAGWMTIDDERYPVSSGATVITPEGAKRGVEAETRLVFLAARIA